MVAGSSKHNARFGYDLYGYMDCEQVQCIDIIDEHVRKQWYDRNECGYVRIELLTYLGCC